MKLTKLAVPQQTQPQQPTPTVRMVRDDNAVNKWTTNLEGSTIYGRFRILPRNNEGIIEASNGWTLLHGVHLEDVHRGIDILEGRV